MNTNPSKHWINRGSGVVLDMINIWTKDEVTAPWNRFKTSSKTFLLTVPRRCFFCGSFMLFLSCFCYVFVCVCLLMPCGHLLGKGWHLGSRLWCLIVKLSLSHSYPGSGMVLDCIDSDLCLLSFFDCIDSWSLSFFLLSMYYKEYRPNHAMKKHWLQNLTF